MRDRRQLLTPITMCLVAAAAFFQARGFSSLLHEALAAPVPSGLDPQRAAPAGELPLHHTSARKILERNPFDSTQGSLLPAPEGAPESPAAAQAIGDPYEAPACPTSHVVALASQADARSSFAIVTAGEGRLRVQQGSELAEGRVWFIAPDRLWVVGAAGLCQTALFAVIPPPVVSASAASSGAPPPPPANKNPATAALIAKIKPLGPREFAIDRSALDQARESYGDLARQVKIRPEVEGGQIQGIRVMAATPGSLEASLGLETGDVIDSLNGHGWAPEEALKAYTDLLSGRDVAIHVRRKGSPLQIDLRVR